MTELHVTSGGRRYAFQAGATVRIGRNTDNDIVVGDPTVSRQHAELSWDGSAWVWQNTGQAATFIGGQPVGRFPVSVPAEVSLASPQGPTLRVELARAAAPGQPPGGPAIGYRAESPAPVTNVAGQQPAGVAGAAAAAPPGPFGAAPQPGAAWMPGPGPAGSPYGLPPGAMPVTPQPGGPGPDSAGNAFQILIPIRSWLTDRGWGQGLRLLVIPYALLPLIFIALFANSGNLTTPGWAYSLYIAPLWLLAFWYLIRPPGRIGPREVLIPVGIVIWTLIWMQLVTINVNSHLPSPNGSLTFPAALGVGFNEEITKALPVLIAAMLLLLVAKKKLDPRMWMIFGTIAGLTFGVREQTFYTASAILGVHQATTAGGAVISVLAFSERVFVDGLQHAVWAGIAGFFIGIAVNYRRRRIPLLILGVTIPAVLHGLNDWSGTAFNTLWVPILIQAVSLLLFLGYTLSAATIERQVRRSRAFRGDSILMETFSQPGEAPVS